MTIKILKPDTIGGAMRQVGEIIDGLQPGKEDELITAGIAVSIPNMAYPWVLDNFGNPTGLVDAEYNHAKALVAHAIEHEELGMNPPVIVDAPLTGSSNGEPGQIAYDNDYFYVCVATDSWHRAAMESF